MNTLRLALRMLVRDWRAGELTVLGLALVLAVAALTSVSFLADRVQQGLILQSHQLLGGDLLLSADHPWRDEFRLEARRQGLQVAESASLLSMVTTAGGAQLVEVKAVSDNYPLRGALRVAPTLGVQDAETHEVPAAGTAWPDERLAAKTDGTVQLGELTLRPGSVLTLDPDRGINAFSLAPRLLINLGDLTATRLVQPGSRIGWRLHVAGRQTDVEAFQRWAEARLGRGERLETLDNARPEVRNTLERAGRFLRLAALLTVVLAAVAVGLAADRYLRRHLDACAVMRCLGASSGQILTIHGGEFVFFGLLATGLGCLLGFASQWLLQTMLGGLLSGDLPWPSWRPWAHGAAVGVTLVAGFVLPPLLRLRRVPTIRVLRREWSAGEPTLLAAYGLGAALLAILMLWIASDARLGLIVLGGFAGAIGIYGTACRSLLVIARRLDQGGRWRPWRLGLAGLHRRWRSTVVQAVALGLGLTTLLLLTVARDDLMASWKNRVPVGAPNRFVINLQPDQRTAFGEFFTSRGLPAPLVEPMVRGRLVAVNGRSVAPGDYAEERAQRLVEREFNLSWASDLPAANSVVAGRWHGDTREPQFSVEQGLADTLGLKVGDDLTYQVAGVSLSAPITSLRKLDWDSMRVNFFVITPPGSLESFPISYITSFHLPVERAGLGNELVQVFPNLTVIDVGTLVRQLQDTLDQVARAVQALFGFALAAGLVVLYAGLQASADERFRELAVMRALGARGKQLRIALASEFAALGALAGLLAGLGAGAIGYALGRFVFHLPYLPGPSILLVGTAAGAIGVTAAGLWAMRDALRRPIMPDLLAY